MMRTTTMLLMLALLTMLVALTGCPRPEAGPGDTPLAGPVAPPAPETPAASGELAEIGRKRAALKSYQVTLTAPGNELVTQWLKWEGGEPVRIKMGVAGEEAYVLTMLDQNVNYMVNKQEKTAIKMAMEADPDGPEVAEAPYLADLDQLAAASPLITSERLDGVDCWKIEVSDEEGTYISWMDKQYGLLRKAQMDDEVMTFAYSQINSVPDSEFELPSGLEIVDLSEGMRGMPAPPR